MRKLSYGVMWQAFVRLGVTIVFFAAAFTAMVFLTDFIAGTSLMSLLERVGKIWTVVIIIVVALPVDLFFSYAANRIVRLLK